MIEAINISKSFGEHQVLKSVSAQFEKGKNNLIIGKSGAGKTVLLKCLVGLHEVDDGHIDFDGRNFSEMKMKDRKQIRKEIGMLFQGGALFDSYNVEDNVMFPLNMFTTMSEEEKLERVNLVLERVKLVNSNKLMPGELSGGMIKRVAIARAISNSPKYLFCDEPNSGLDPNTAGVIDDLIAEITEEYDIVTIVNTHDMNSVLKIGDHISFVNEGQICWQGNRDEILDSDNEILNDFVFSTELTKRLKQSKYR
ncbi:MULTISPECIES: ABC transporter ATP-binding protein [unclassified Lentimicrobium]|uniref:ABC transporter ATP-binding protein n=1 Tax=unclassified Lentimicrobium TaxID=2677434 RepID=UPI0015549A9A|nr:MULTISPECIES: ATP-binding cassette domain-containing protein [unclassified Lentimicrobium]NPD44282.1 ATP-binding cassette domain-containing protein [Lentimicrobium sp. S6]NPD84613.1 ATP-binding cassette domain-containing protein [Lentimicrobium sp. L6]